MRNLLPEFIVENYKNGKMHGEIRGATLFLDISGFTQTTEKLMKQGIEGAEILSEILNYLFTVPVEAVHNNGGFIVTFAGDAFTAIFPEKGQESVCHRALAAANRILEFMGEELIYESRFGEFPFSVKLGLAYDSSDWGILGSESAKTYYFKGAGVDDCAEAEHNASLGEMWCSHSFFEEIRAFVQKKSNSENGQFHRLEKWEIPTLAILKKAESELDMEVLHLFAGKKESEFPKGEFRENVAVFISFESDDLQEFMNLVFQFTEAYGSSRPHLDFGDKGGNVLLFFGAPVSYENNSLRALKLANAIKIAAYPKHKLRIGIAKGTLYSGFNGADARQEFACLGNTTNLSARLMMKADMGDIFVEEVLTENKSFNFKHVADFLFKGRSQQIPTYKLLGQAKSRSVFYSSLFIQRPESSEAFFDFLRPLYFRSFNGVLYIDGDAGVGKSRFIYEEINQAEIEPTNFRFFPCDSILRESFNPVAHFLRDTFKNPETEEDFKQKFDNIVSKCPDKELAKDLDYRRALIASLIPLKLEDNIFEKMSAKAQFENLLIGLKALVKVLSLERPFVLIFEDAQWIDDSSQDFLRFLVNNIEDFAISILLVSRNNDDHSRFEIPKLPCKRERIDIHPFNDEETIQFLKTNVGLEGVPESTSELFKEKCSGNPFYIEQLLSYLQENSLLNDDFTVTSKNIQIPGNINNLIIARIDRLRKNLRVAIKTASVIGKRFSIKLLQRMLSKEDIRKDLHEIQNEKIAIALNELLYIFHSAMVYDAVYQIQLKSELRRLHNLAGELIESEFSEDLENHYFELANHFQVAENSEKAIKYFGFSAEFARRRFYNKQAIQYFSLLIEHPDVEKAKLAKSLLGRGALYERTGQVAEAMKDYSRAREISDANGFSKTHASSLRFLGWVNFLSGNFDKASDFYQQALEITIASEDYDGSSYIYSNLGAIQWRKGNFEKALSFYEKQRSLVEFDSNKHIHALSIGNSGLVFSDIGRFDEALKCYKKQLQFGEELQDKGIMAAALSNLGLGFWKQKKHDQAMEFFEREKKLRDELGDIAGSSRTLGNMGLVYRDLGKIEKAKSAYKAKMLTARELGSPQSEAIALVNIALILVDELDYNQALEYLDSALDLARRLKIPMFIAGFLLDKADLAIRLERITEAQVAWEEGRVIAEKLKNTDYLFKASLLQSRLESAKKTGEPSKRLLKILETEKDSENIEELQFWLANIFHNAQNVEYFKYKERALNSLGLRYEKMPNLEIKNKIDALEALK